MTCTLNAQAALNFHCFHRHWVKETIDIYCSPPR
jgi:hypothetical protein